MLKLGRWRKIDGGKGGDIKQHQTRLIIFTLDLIHRPQYRNSEQQTIQQSILTFICTKFVKLDPTNLAFKKINQISSMTAEKPSALILIADGTEKIEFVTPYECVLLIHIRSFQDRSADTRSCSVLTRAGFEVKSCGVQLKEVFYAT